MAILPLGSTPSSHQGVTHTQQFDSTELPISYRKRIPELLPNGDLALTGLVKKTRKEGITSARFNWFDNPFVSPSATINAYQDVELADALLVGDATAVGATLYLKVALVFAQKCRPGITIVMGDKNAPERIRRARIAQVVLNGANSVLGVTMLEADAAEAGNLSAADNGTLAGDANEEFAKAPQSVFQHRREFANFAQIFRTPLEFSETALATTGDAYRIDVSRAKEQKQKLQDHFVQMENAFLLGGKFDGTGENGRPQRWTGGMQWFISTYGTAASQIVSFRNSSATAYAGKTWDLAGEQFIKDQLELVFTYGGSTRWAVGGVSALTALDRVASLSAEINIVPGAKVFGTNIRQWISTQGVINLMTHPALNVNAAYSNSLFVFDPANAGFAPMPGRDTKLKTNIQDNDVDGVIDEWITEAGFTFDFPETFFMWNGLGIDNIN